MSAPELDPGACWIRHVSRGQAAELGAVTVLGAVFTPQPLEGVNGRQGWQDAAPELRLSDDGSFSVRFPNAAGEDGKLHRTRFAILTDPLYRPGEEWLEFWREPGDLLMVGTPVRAKLDRGELVLEGLDANVLTRSALSSETDLWVGAHPLEVLEAYASVPVLRLAQDFGGISGAVLPAGWSSGGTLGTAPQSSARDGIALTDAGSATPQFLRFDAPGAPVWSGDFVAEVRLRHTVNLVASNGRIRVLVGRAGGLSAQVGPQHTGPGSAAGNWLPTGAPTGTVARLQYDVPSVVVHRMIGRGEWLFYFVNGELVWHGRRTDPTVPPTTIIVDVVQGAATVESVRLVTLEPLLMRDAPADTRLPGAPTPGGLRGRYYLENEARSKVPASWFRFAALSPFLEPYAERLEAPGFAGATPPAWMPQGPPSGEAFSARWTGAIYFDLEAGDRVVSFDTGTDPLGRARMWIGGRLVLDYATPAGSPQVFSAPLRAILGTRTGWWPITVEYSHLTGAGGLAIYDQAGAVYVAGNRVAIPIDRLSPLGTVDREVRNESHRSVFGDVAEAMGYQWRLEPRSLESGRFPGQIVAAPRVGRDTAHVIDAPDAFEIATEIDAGDAVDGLMVDASGLATIAEGAQLSYEVAAPNAGHLVYSSAYESLSDITEEPLLRQRAVSLLTTRSSPAENVGVRPKGTRELVDTFPLPATPDLARLLWQPGDGIRLALAELGVVDATPRQLTVVQWPLRPDGAAPPVVSYRQRGRGQRAALERLSRIATAPRRSYQGQLGVVVGSVGCSPAQANVGDVNSRLNMPSDRKVVALDLVVQAASAGSRTLYLNAVATSLVLTRPGRYSLLEFYAPDGTNSRLFAELRDAATPTGGTWNFALESTVLF